MQRGVRETELHAAAVRVPGALPRPVLREPERRRPAYHPPHHGLEKKGEPPHRPAIRCDRPRGTVSDSDWSVRERGAIRFIFSRRESCVGWRAMPVTVQSSNTLIFKPVLSLRPLSLKSRSDNVTKKAPCSVT